MPDLPRISLPPELIPADGRFGSGPSKVRVDGLAELGASGSAFLGTSHRQHGVRSIVAGVRRSFAELFSLPPDFDIVLGVGGATAFWDAATFGLIERRSQHLVFGEFSGKFAAAAAGAPHLEEPKRIESDPGTHPEPVADMEIDLYAQTHNETSTGVAAPIVRPEGAAGIVAVDATSAAGAMAIDHSHFDVYYFSPQKVFGAEGGLWIALCSPAAVDRIERIAASGRWIPPFLDLRAALENSRKDQTYNTPALATLFLLNRQLEAMLARGGLDWAVKRSLTSSRIVYTWAEASTFATPFVSETAGRSPTVVTVDFDAAISADTIEGVLRSNGILDTFGYRKLGRNQLRIACFPNIEPEDVETLVAAIDHIAARL